MATIAQVISVAVILKLGLPMVKPTPKTQCVRPLTIGSQPVDPNKEAWATYIFPIRRDGKPPNDDFIMLRPGDTITLITGAKVRYMSAPTLQFCVDWLP